MKWIFAPLIAAGILLPGGGCSTGREQAGGKWEYQVATNSVEANQMADKGWKVAGFSRYTDATGQPQVNYTMKRPNQ